MTPQKLILKINALERDGLALLRLPAEEARRLLPAWRKRHDELFNWPDLRPDLGRRLAQIEIAVSERLS